MKMTNAKLSKVHAFNTEDSIIFTEKLSFARDNQRKIFKTWLVWLTKR